MSEKLTFEKSKLNIRQFVQLPARGPYIRGSQYDDKWEKLTWADAIFLASREGLVTEILDVKLNEVLYQKGPNGECEKVAYYVDTSD